jgi:hypothetical protein
MTTVQIVGIAVAVAVVALLVIALLVTRRRGPKADPQARAGESFLDAAPQDTLDGLGRAEVPVEDVTLDPQATRALADERPARQPLAASGREEDTLVPPELPAEAPPLAPAQTPPTGRDEQLGTSLSLDWGDQKEPVSAPEPIAPLSWAPAAAAAGQAGDEPRERTPEADARGTTPPRAPSPAAAPSQASPAPAPGAGPAPERTSRKVPLADIIVTTSRKVIDLDDPEVRRMLTDLVKFEIDQATRYREQGQRIDAVLQLTEAEKISRALGMNESAGAIRRMMKDLQG